MKKINSLLLRLRYQISHLHLLQVIARPVKSIFNVFHIFTSLQLVLDGLPSAAFNGAGSDNDEAISLFLLF